MGPLGGYLDWGNSNPDVFADSSGYRGFRLRLSIRSVVAKTPYPTPPALTDALEEVGACGHHPDPL